MRATGWSAFVAGCVVVAVAAPLAAQSLADVAKKEEERRKQAAPAGKVYTNKDLGPVPPAPEPSADAAAKADTKPEKESEKGAGGATGDKAADKSADKDKAGAPPKDQKYWHDRMQKAREAADRDQTLADAMQSRINALTTDFVNRDDPAQRAVIARDRDRALAELDRLKKQIVDDRKAITDLEEEARRAGVPPGWLR
jgi:hypothetical protein